jgi:dTMP kinase
MHLDQYRQPFAFGCRGRVELLRQREAVHGVDAIEEICGAAGLVALQVPDEVPRCIDVRELWLLRLELLHAVFAKVPQAGVVRRADCFRRKRLRNGDNRNLVGAASGALRRARDAFPNALEIRCNGRDFRRHRRDSSMRERSARHSLLVADKLNATSMPVRGKFIVLEGIDGSGKRTQLEALVRAFTARGVALAQVSFPRYEGFFGKLVARFLNGEFGALADVDPHFSALLYAADRLESKAVIEDALASGKTVLADRYVGSNLAHQGSRMPREKRDEFIAWLRQLEYDIYGLPPEDLVVYLHVPVTEAHRLAGERGARDYTKLSRDLQEADVAHLDAAAQVYDELARQQHWVKVECFEAAAGALRAPASIHEEILAAVEARLAPALGARG